MTFRRALLLCALFGIAPLPAAAEATILQIEACRTVDDLLGLGARKLTAAEFRRKVVGRPLTGDGLSWIIAGNGTARSISDDGTWEPDARRWHLKDDAFCTRLDGRMTCRAVYMIGAYLRMAHSADALALGGWTAKVAGRGSDRRAREMSCHGSRRIGLCP